MTVMKINSESSSFDFVAGKWQHEINVRDFIQKNYTSVKNLGHEI